MVSSVGKMTSKKVLLTPKQKFDSLLIESVKAYPELYNNSRGNRDPFWNQIYTDMKNCNIGYEFDRKYLPIKWKSIRDAWVKLRKDEKDTPEELNFLIQHVKKTSRFSDASQKSSASYSREEAKDMFESNNPDVEEIEESTVDFETMQKKEQWLKRTKSLKEKEEELQILKKIRLANEIKNNPDNLRQIDTNFSRKPKKSNFFATLENRLNNIVEDQALDETDENWCELIVKLILSVEESKQLQVFNAIMLKSEEFQSKK